MTFSTFTAAYSAADTAQRWAQWTQQRDRWLAEQRSAHTRRAYAAAHAQFFAYCPIEPWTVTHDHARAWRDYLSAQGAAPSTISQRLAAMSSFYAFAIGQRSIVDGREVSFFTDAAGFTRSNPFRIQRPKVTKFEKGNPLPPDLVRRTLASINPDTLTGSRNYALLLTYLGTGYRNAEVREMQWGDIYPNPEQEGQYLYRWAGKGAKTAIDPLPVPVVDAIRHHLAIAGRLDTIRPQDYIWQRIRPQGIANLTGAAPVDHGPISQKQVVRILRTCLTATGLTQGQARRYRVHDLRHTFCVEHYREFGDLVALRQQSHHANLSTLEVYVRNAAEVRTDTHSARLFARLGIE